MSEEIRIESHPFPPFLPPETRVLMLGTFPPKSSRWSMPFFYPNKINDMWRVMGIVFYNNKNQFWDDVNKQFRLPAIKRFLEQKHIGMWDTAARVRRLKDNASDKYLEIVETIDLASFLHRQPTIQAIVTTGEKASSVIAGKVGVDVPKIGVRVACDYGGHRFWFYRMPSTSRAYPLPLEKKAQAYGHMFASLGYVL